MGKKLLKQKEKHFCCECIIYSGVIRAGECFGILVPMDLLIPNLHHM